MQTTDFLLFTLAFLMVAVAPFWATLTWGLYQNYRRGENGDTFWMLVMHATLTCIWLWGIALAYTRSNVSPIRARELELAIRIFLEMILLLTVYKITRSKPNA